MSMERELQTMGTVRERPAPLVFGPPARPLFGFFHAPQGSVTRATGIVLCNPLGYEAMCTHLAYRQLAERLAAKGFPALRFDYEGTGDSSGHPHEPGRVSAWLASIDYAIEELRSRAGVSSFCLFGVRFGATLAAVAASKRTDVEDVILWAPATKGRVYVRELRAFRMLKEKEAPKPRLDGDEEVAGYLFDKATVTDMSALDLLAGSDHVAKRALVIAREGVVGGEDKLTAHLAKTGAEVTTLVESGYAKMMRDPQETVVPFETLDTIINWLPDRTEDRAAPPSRRPDTTWTTATPAGNLVREQAIEFGDGQRLFGILSEPTERPVIAGSPAVLFLNVGANHRVGPNRMYVAMARDLAALGYRCLRFDVGGLGDSRPAPNAPGARLYSKDSVADVRAAMDLLGRMRDTQRFVVVGLCSGAYLAFHTTIEDTRVAGQVLLNPQTFEWKEGDSLELSMRKSFMSTRYYARAILKPAVWKRALTGGVNLHGIALVLGERLATAAKNGVHALGEKVLGRTGPQTEIRRAFHAMSDRGVESLLVFSFNDGGLDMIAKHLGSNVRAMRGKKNFHFEIVDGADHTFTPLNSQRVLHNLITGYVTRLFQ
jgi:pimeloyl-ACP methyl ester carboxylesterase